MLRRESEHQRASSQRTQAQQSATAASKQANDNHAHSHPSCRAHAAQTSRCQRRWPNQSATAAQLTQSGRNKNSVRIVCISFLIHSPTANLLIKRADRILELALQTLLDFACASKQRRTNTCKAKIQCKQKNQQKERHCW